jgi:hypothetical protein
MIFQDAREVRASEAMPGATRKMTPLLGTALITWREDNYRDSLVTTWANLRADREGSLRAQKQLHVEDAFPVVVAVSDVAREGEKSVDKPRAIVFGSDSLLIDQPPVPAGIDEVRQQIVSDSLDWLRERNASIGVTPRKLPVFMLEKPVEWSSQLVLLLMIAMGIATVGGGVWLSRRR